MPRRSTGGRRSSNWHPVAVTSDRGSYRKTTAVAAAVVAGGLSLLALAAAGFTRTGGWPFIATVGLTASALLIGIVTAWAMLVTAGGLIALRRDRLEEAGLPYASAARRESVAGPFRRWLIRVLMRRVAAPGDAHRSPSGSARRVGGDSPTRRDSRHARREWDAGWRAIHAGDGGVLRPAGPVFSDASTSSMIGFTVQASSGCTTSYF